MTLSPTIVGDNTVIWGASTVYTGYVLSGSKDIEALMEAVKDQNGFTVTKVFYDNSTLLEFTLVVQTAEPSLAIGDLVTICGVANAIVEKSHEEWKNDKVAIYSCTARAHPGIL